MRKRIGITLTLDKRNKIYTIPYTSTNSKMCREFFWKNLTGLFITPRLYTPRNSEVEKTHHAHIHIYFGNVQRCIVFGRTYGLLLIVFFLSVFLSHSVFNIWGIFQIKLKRLTDACLRYCRYQVAQRGYIYCMRKKE